jgi:hypothetical protein
MRKRDGEKGTFMGPNSTRVDNTCIEKFLNHFLNFIFLGKGVTIGMDIERKDS